MSERPQEGYWIKVPSELLACPHLTPAAKLCWMALATWRACKTIDPGLTAIGARCGIGKRWLMQAVRRLRTLGLLSMKMQRGQTTTYVLLDPTKGCRFCLSRGTKGTGEESAPVNKKRRSGEEKSPVTGEQSSPKEDKNNKKRREEKAAAQASPSPSPLAFTGQHLKITKNQHRALADAFPWVQLEAEYRKMNAWLNANPGRRPRNESRFAHNWVSRITPPKGGPNRAEQRRENNREAIAAGIAE